MNSSKKLKIYLALGLCFIVIIGFWIYSFKLNLTQGLKTESAKNGQGLADLKNSIIEAFKKHPLVLDSNAAPTEQTNNPLNQ